MLRTGIYIVALILIAFICKDGLDLYHQIRTQKELKEDHAAINMVNYGLFDIQDWKTKVLGIFKNRIDEYTIEPSAYKALDKELQVYLRSLYKRYFESGELIDIILEKLTESGKMNKMFLAIIQKNISSQLGNLDLEKEIPGLSAQLVSEIRENEPQIKEYFQRELLSMVMDDVTVQLKDRRTPYFEKYNFSDFEETNNYLTNEIKSNATSIRPALTQNVIALGALLLLMILASKIIGFRMLILGLTLTSVVLLVLGISLPMIDIDARLNAFSIGLMGEEVSFAEQTIYFQSKSILDVTQTLWRGQGIDLKLVALLVFMFSIIFPFLKLILSAFYLFSKRVSSSRVVENIIFHLGKWSMADVFVVAMFMAYIGFYGIVTSQLSNISQNPNGYAVETLNYSSLAAGALYFTFYTILSIVIGVLINRKSNREISTAE